MKSQKEQQANENSDDGGSEGDVDEEDKQNKRKRVRVECVVGNRTEEELMSMHPQRTTFEYQLWKS